GLNPSPVVSGLLDALNGKDTSLHRPAVIALGRIKNEAAMQGLVVGLGNKDKKVREAAAASFGAIGKAALPILTKALNDPDPNVAKLAADTIKRIQGK